MRIPGAPPAPVTCSTTQAQPAPGALTASTVTAQTTMIAVSMTLRRSWVSAPGHQLSYTAGRITDGSATVEDLGWELFRLMLELASGRRKTWAEQWKLRNALVLFNPASVT